MSPFSLAHFRTFIQQSNATTRFLANFCVALIAHITLYFCTFYLIKFTDEAFPQAFSPKFIAFSIKYTTFMYSINPFRILSVFQPYTSKIVQTSLIILYNMAFLMIFFFTYYCATYQVPRFTITAPPAQLPTERQYLSKILSRNFDKPMSRQHKHQITKDKMNFQVAKFIFSHDITFFEYQTYVLNLDKNEFLSIYSPIFQEVTETSART